MLERHIHHVGIQRPPSDEDADAARDRLGACFPRGATRRMTHLGLLVGAALDGLAVRVEDTVIYASTYAETRALEDYLQSFPQPSPMLFQTSIHPSAVEQALIARRQPVRRFLPFSGRERLVGDVLLAALLDPSPRVILVGGEERGTWMLEHGVASDRAFAFALALDADAAGASGRVAFLPDAKAAPDEPGPSLAKLADALAERRPLRWPDAGGQFMLAWAE